MKRYLKECIHLCVVFCVLFGIGLSVFIYDSRPHEVQYIQEHSSGFFFEKGREFDALGYNGRYSLAVVEITGVPFDSQGVTSNRPLYVTHTQARVVRVLHGDLYVGEKIHLLQKGNSKVSYTDSLLQVQSVDKKCTRIDEGGGYFQKGELLLVLLYPRRDYNEYNGDLHCGLYTNHVCCFTFEYAMRTVNNDGTLGYRADSDYGKYQYTPGAFGFELPYSQYKTIQEICDAVPYWVEKAIEQRIGRKLTEAERIHMAKDKHKEAMNALSSNNIQKYLSSLSAEK